MDIKDLQRITEQETPVIYIDDTITGATYLDWFALVPFQGDLKELSAVNMDKMLLSLINHGFFDIKKVWQREKGCYVTADGHQTLATLTHYKPLLDLGQILMLRKSDNQPTTKVPCVPINASSEQDLAEKLLLINSEFGTITQDGLGTFNQKYGITDLFMDKVVVPKWEAKTDWGGSTPADWSTTKNTIEMPPIEPTEKEPYEPAEFTDLIFPLNKDNYDFAMSVIKQVRKEQMFEKNSDALMYILEQFQTYVGTI